MFLLFVENMETNFRNAIYARKCIRDKLSCENVRHGQPVSKKERNNYADATCRK